MPAASLNAWALISASSRSRDYLAMGRPARGNSHILTGNVISCYFCRGLKLPRRPCSGRAPAREQIIAVGASRPQRRLRALAQFPVNSRFVQGGRHQPTHSRLPLPAGFTLQRQRPHGKVGKQPPKSPSPTGAVQPLHGAPTPAGLPFPGQAESMQKPRSCIAMVLCPLHFLWSIFVADPTQNPTTGRKRHERHFSWVCEPHPDCGEPSPLG